VSSEGVGKTFGVVEVWCVGAFAKVPFLILRIGGDDGDVFFDDGAFIVCHCLNEAFFRIGGCCVGSCASFSIP